MQVDEVDAVYVRVESCDAAREFQVTRSMSFRFNHHSFSYSDMLGYGGKMRVSLVCLF